MVTIPSAWEFPIKDGLVLVRTDSFDLYALNSTATYVWTLLKSDTSLTQASEDYSIQYGVPLETAGRDIRSAWGDWEKTLLAPSSPEALAEPPTFCARVEDFFGGVTAHCRFCDQIISVTLDRGVLVDEIIPRLAPLAVPPALNPHITFNVVDSEDGYHIYLNGRWIKTQVDLSEIRIALLQEIVRYAMPDRKWLATFHAAACGNHERCILFPAASHSGKTTLAAALMHAGFVLYTEDSAILHAEGLTVPVTPFSLMIREGSWPVLMPRFPELASAPVISHSGTDVRFLAPKWDGRAGCAPVSGIVFSRYEPDSVIKIERLDTFETLIRLQESGFWVEHDKQSIAEFLDWLASRPAYKMTYSDLNETVKATRELLQD